MLDKTTTTVLRLNKDSNYDALLTHNTELATTQPKQMAERHDD